MKRLLVLTLLLLTLACGDEPSAAPPSAAGPISDLSPSEFLEKQLEGGNTVVLLLGMEGCSGTREATARLAELAPDLGENIAVGRIDVPPPGGDTERAADWPHAYYYGLDEEREFATTLDFFYYPTLYVLDRDGEIRYSGGLEAEGLVEMVADIRGEKPGGEKVYFTRPLPAIGSTAPAVRGRSPAGEEVRADVGKGTPLLVFFTSVTCPFASKALDDLPYALLDFEEDAYEVVVVEKGGSPRAVKALHERLGVEEAVIHDPQGALCETFGVEPVPFFFLIDGEGNIAARGPYMDSAVTISMAKTLGVEIEAPEEQSSGAG